ncbi:MAG: twin-arginine translocation pathway signal protein, partial [Pseudomonadota bacterium]
MRLNRRPVLAALATALAGAFALPAAAQEGEPILIGEINHYKRLAAFAEPYKKGIELAL